MACIGNGLSGRTFCAAVSVALLLSTQSTRAGMDTDLSSGGFLEIYQATRVRSSPATSHFRLELSRTGDYREAIARTFATVGVALSLTSVVLIFNFSVYLASSVKMFIHMGVLMTLGVLAALLADLFVTPVLLNWSKPFQPEKYDE